MTTDTQDSPSTSWYNSIFGMCALGRDLVSSSSSSFVGTLAQAPGPIGWATMGIFGAVGSTAQFAKEKTEQGIAGLWATLGSIWMSALSGASREEAEATVHASTLAAGGTLAINGIQKMTSRVAPQEQPRSFFSNATGQLVSGVGIIYGALKLGPTLTTYMSFLGTTAMTSTVFIKHGINRIQNGDYWKGLGYAALGAAGVVTSAYTAYQLMLPTEPQTALYEDVPFMDYSNAPVRRIRIATLYDNGQDAERDRVSETIVPNQSEYAEKWGYEREVVSDARLKSKCWADTAQTIERDCAPHFVKIEYAVDRCHDPRAQGKWIVVMDDDMPITNPNIDLMKAIDQLRTLPDGRVVPAKMILTQEAGDWPGLCKEHFCFKIPGIPVGKHHPLIAINSGLIMFEAQDGSPQCKLLERALEHRNTHMDRDFSISPAIAKNIVSCPTLGICKPGITGLADQTALALAMQEGFDREGEAFFGRVVHVVPQRDEANKYRSHIALNTLWRGGCYCPEGHTAPYDIGDFDSLPKNIHGVWRKRDLCGQPAGVGVRGKYTPRDGGKACIADPSLPTTNPRMEKIQEMLALREKPIQWTFVMTHNEQGDSPISTTSLVRPNHKLMAYRHRGEFIEDTSPMQLVATHPFKDKDGMLYEPCLNEGRVVPCGGIDLHTEPAVPYWRKVDFSKRWVHQPIDPKVTNILVHGDTDLVYDKNLDLYQMWISERTGTQAPFLVAADDHSVSTTNTGFFMFERSPETRDFIDHWSQGVDWPSFVPTDPDGPTLATGGVKQTTSLHEQQALNVMLDTMPGIRDSIVKVIPLWDQDRPYGAVNALCREGHWTSVQSWNREVQYDNDPDWIKPKPGHVALMQPAGVPKMGRDFGEPESRNRPIRREVLSEAMKKYLNPLEFMPIYSVSSRPTASPTHGQGPIIEEIEE